MTDERKEMEQEINASRVDRVERKQSVTEKTLDRIGKSLYDSRRDYDEPEPIYWQGEPIVEDESEEAIVDHPFRVYLEGGNIKVSEGKCKLWTGDAWQSETESEDGTSTWGALTSEYVYAQLTYVASAWSFALGHNATNPQGSDSQTQRTWVLAEIDASGVISQEWMGAIYETMDQ